MQLYWCILYVKVGIANRRCLSLRKCKRELLVVGKIKTFRENRKVLVVCLERGKGKSLMTLAQCCYDKILVVRLTMLVSIPSKGLPLPWLSSSTNKYLVPAVSFAAKMRLKSITPAPTLHTSSLSTL